MITELDKEMISQIFHIGYEAMKLGIISDGAANMTTNILEIK